MSAPTPAVQEQKELATKKKPIEQLKDVMKIPSVVEQFQNSMAENSSLFVASIIDLFTSDEQLQKCPPGLVVAECLKAATLKLPINKGLGFAWVIARFNSKAGCHIPAFQIGWRGIVQLAQRTGQYRTINCGPVYEGELKKTNKLTGEVDISGEPTSDVAVGFFAYIELLNGFSKTLYWSKEKVESHAIKYNPECKKAGKLVNIWKEHFESRAMATVLKYLIQKYGIMSVEMTSAVRAEEEHISPLGQLEMAMGQHANKQLIDMETGEITAVNVEAPVEQQSTVHDDGPGY